MRRKSNIARALSVLALAFYLTGFWPTGLADWLGEGMLTRAEAASGNWVDQTLTAPSYENGAFKISSANELAFMAKAVSDNLSVDVGGGTYKWYRSADYRLVSDIDIGAHYWTPIGNDSGRRFAGKFHGENNEIAGLTIDAPGSYNIGLFGYTGTGALIENVGLVGVDVSGRDYVGGLVGYNEGTVTASYATGSVRATGDFAYVGGLVGANNGTVTASYATGSVRATGSGAWVGGLVGVNYGTVTASYATGSVRATGDFAYVGGLVGANNGGTVAASYAAGNVGATGSGARVGGLIGGSSGVTADVTSSNFDPQGTGQSSGIGADNNNQGANVTPLSTDKFAVASVPGFDAASWDIRAGYYPQIKALANGTDKMKQASGLSVVPVFLSNDETVRGVKTWFTVPDKTADGAKITWTSSPDARLEIKTTVREGRIAVGLNSVGSADLTATANNMSKTFTMYVAAISAAPEDDVTPTPDDTIVVDNILNALPSGCAARVTRNADGTYSVAIEIPFNVNFDPAAIESMAADITNLTEIKFYSVDETGNATEIPRHASMKSQSAAEQLKGILPAGAKYLRITGKVANAATLQSVVVNSVTFWLKGEPRARVQKANLKLSQLMNASGGGSSSCDAGSGLAALGLLALGFAVRRRR